MKLRLIVQNCNSSLLFRNVKLEILAREPQMYQNSNFLAFKIYTNLKFWQFLKEDCLALRQCMYGFVDGWCRFSDNNGNKKCTEAALRFTGFRKTEWWLPSFFLLWPYVHLVSKTSYPIGSNFALKGYSYFWAQVYVHYGLCRTPFCRLFISKFSSLLNFSLNVL